MGSSRQVVTQTTVSLTVTDKIYYKDKRNMNLISLSFLAVVFCIAASVPIHQSDEDNEISTDNIKNVDDTVYGDLVDYGDFDEDFDSRSSESDNVDLGDLFGLAAEIGQGLLGIFSEKVRLFNMIANDQEFQSRVGDVVRLGANVTNSA